MSPELLMKGAGTNLLYFFLQNATEKISIILKGLDSPWFQAHFLNTIQELLLEVLHLQFLCLSSLYPTLLLYVLTDLCTKHFFTIKLSNFKVFVKSTSFIVNTCF